MKDIFLSDSNEKIADLEKERLRYGAGLYLILLLTLLILIWDGTYLFSTYKIELDNAYNTAGKNLHISEQLVDGMIRQIEISLAAVSDEASRSYTTSFSVKTVSPLIKRNFERLGFIDSLRVADASGNVLFGEGNILTQAVSMADRGYFKELKNDPSIEMVVSPPIKGRISGKWVVTFARRITLSDGSFGGSVYATITADYLESLLYKKFIQSDDSISLRYKDLALFLKVSGADPTENRKLQGSVKVPQDFRQQIESGAEAGTVRGVSLNDRIDRIYAFQKLGKYPYYLISSVSYPESMKGFKRLFYESIIFTTLYFLFIALILFFVRANQRIAANSINQLKIISEMEAKYRFLTENSHDVIWSFDPGTMRFTYVSPSVLHLRGYTAQEVISQRFEAALTPKSLILAQDVMRKKLEQIASKDLSDLTTINTVEQTRKDGSSVWTEVTTRYVVDDTGEVVSIVGVTRDISSRIEQEKLINKALREWETTFDGIMDSVSLIDSGQNIIRCNKATSHLLGLDYNDIIGKKCYSVFHGSNHPIDACPMTKALLSKKLESSEIISDGRTLDVTVHPIFNDSGEVVSAVHIVRDITDDVELRKKLLEVTELFNLLLRHTPVYTFIKRVEEGSSVVIAASENFAKMIGFSGSQMIGKSMEEFFPSEFARKITEDDIDIIGKGELFQAEEVFGDRTYITVKFPITRDSGETLIAGFTVDITEQKDMERSLSSAKEQLFQQEKLASIGQLAAGVAHEINNPVGFVKSNITSLQKYFTKIESYLELVEKLTLPYIPPELSEKILSERKTLKIDYLLSDLNDIFTESLEGVRRVQRIVSDLVSYARGGSEVSKTVNMNDSLKQAINIVWNEIKNRCELIQELSDIPLVEADLQKLTQVFVNLIINASHALPETGGKIMIRSFFENGKGSVTVADNGCGIPDEIKTRIFDPFFTTKEQGKGTGLGLSISREIVAKYGGTLEVESRVGEGATFTLSFPCSNERS